MMMSGERRGARRGMTVLGKIPAVPKPINLPSQRLENRGLDPNVELVPKGSLSWGSGRSPPTTNSSWANAPSSSPPVSTGAWGNIAAKPVTNSGAAWSTGTSRPSSAGGLRPSSAGGTRPSSAGGTRPSSAGSVLTPDSATGLGAWGTPTSRPSSASGALGIAQSEPVITRPKSAETRMANTRFSTEGSASGPAWETGSRKLIEDSHQATRFTLTTGDFPSLGSEKVQNLRPQQKDQMGVPDEKVHAYEERTSSAQSASYAYDDMPPQPSDGYGYQFDRRGKDNWIRENPSFRGPCPVPEGTWYRDGHATTPIHAVHPPSCDTWHRDSESNGPDDHWHRIGPSNGPYAPSGPGRYPHEPVGFVHQQGFPGPAPYGRGSHGSAGEGYGPFMRPGVMLPERPAPPFAPSMYPGPYDYYGYPGVPRPGYHSLDEREMMLGMTGVPGKYNSFPHQRPHETFNGYPHTGVGSQPPQNMPGLVRERSETIGHDESSFESSRESLQCREADVSKEAASKMDNHYRQPLNKDQSSVKRISSEPRRNSGAMFLRPQFGHRDWGAVAANDEPMDFSRPVFENETHPVLISAKGNTSHGLSEGRTATSNPSKQNAEETDMNRPNKLSERDNKTVANSTFSRDKEALSNEVLEEGGLSSKMTSKELAIIAEEKKDKGKIEEAKEKAEVNLDETSMKIEAGANHSPDMVAECSDLIAECSDFKSTQPRQRSRHHNKKIRSKFDSVANSVDQVDCENIPEKAEHLSNQSREVLEPSKLSENIESKASATAFVAENPISHLKGESSNSSLLTGDKISVDNISKQTGERHNKKVQRKPYPAKRAGRDHGLQDVRVVDKGHAGEGMVWAPVRMAMLKHEDAIAEKDDSANVQLSKVKRPEMERYSPKPVTAHPGLCETVSKHAAEEEGGLPPSTEQSQHGLSKSASPQPGHQVSVSETVTGQHEPKELSQKETISKHVPGQQQQEVTLGIRRMHQPKPTANKTARAFQRHIAHEHAIPSDGVQVQEKFSNGPQPRSPVWQQARKQQPHNTNEEISQDVRVADRVHGGEGMIWAPVRAASKTTEATFTADANEKKDDGDTGHQQCKTKRPEIERYTPKAVIAQGQQDAHKATGTQLAQQDNMSPGQRMPKPSVSKSSKQYHKHAVHETAVALPDRVQTPPEKFVSGLQSKSPVWQQARKQTSHVDDDMTQKVSHQQEAPRRVQPVHRQQGFINPNTNEKDKHKDVGSTLQTVESVREEKKGSHSDKNQKGQFDSDKHENISGRGLQSMNSKVETQKHSFGEAPKLHSRLQYQPVGNSGQQQSSASSNVQSRSNGGHNFVQGNTHWEQKRDHGHQRRKYNGRVTARPMDLERREHVTKSRMVIDATGGAVPGQVAT